MWLLDDDFKEENIMKAKVRLTYSVEMFVEGESEEVIEAWLNRTTPAEAKEFAANNFVTEDYSEEIICGVQDNSVVDYVIP